MTGLPRYAPMLATAGVVPRDDIAWNYEVKFDGIRATCYIADELRILSRNDKDITAAWPELAALAPANPPFIVDGEIVALTADGRSSFEALQPRMHQRNPATIRALATTTPITYMIFDLLHIDERSLIDLPYQQRRELLEQLGLRGPYWQTPPRLSGPGATVLDAVWVEPELVGEVTFIEWTGDGRLRHPSWRGLRFDKDPRDIRREP